MTGPALVPIPHVALSPTPRRGFWSNWSKKVILFWSNVFFLLLIPSTPCTPPANLIIPKLQPHLPRTYPLPCACIPSVITDLQQTRFALAPAATDWGFPPTRPIPSPFGAATHPQCSLGKAGGRVWEQQLQQLTHTPRLSCSRGSDCPPGSGDTGCPLCSALFPALISSTCFSR